jgi:hypothetical protein
MTEQKPTSETQNSPKAPDSKETRPADATGFFNRVRRELKPGEEPTHPSEAAEIVIIEEESGDEKTRF